MTTVRRGVGKGPDWSRDSPQVRLLCSLRVFLFYLILSVVLGIVAVLLAASGTFDITSLLPGWARSSELLAALYSMARSARCDVRWVATVFVGPTIRACPPSSCGEHRAAVVVALDLRCAAELAIAGRALERPALLMRRGAFAERPLFSLSPQRGAASMLPLAALSLRANEALTTSAGDARRRCAS